MLLAVCIIIATVISIKMYFALFAYNMQQKKGATCTAALI